MQKYDVIIIGAGLAGLSAAHELTKQGKRVVVLEARPALGGRTSSWQEHGMSVESGLHRFLGYYKHLPHLLKECGVDVNKIVQWEYLAELRVLNGPRAVYGTSLLKKPVKTIIAGLTNNHIVDWKDKLSLFPFFVKGLWYYWRKPLELDTYSIAAFAKQCGVSQRVIDRAIYALSAGIFFLPPEKYSAFVFFNPLWHTIPVFYNFKEGAFLGGMTDIMITPIVKKIKKSGSQVRTNSPVDALLVENGRVVGVKTKGKKIQATHVVLATPLGSAQNIVKASSLKHPWLEKYLVKLPMMSEANMQLELTCPAYDKDYTVFTPRGTMTTFAEQSRTTFRHTKGRMGVILTNSDSIPTMKKAAILKKVIADAKAVGLDIEKSIKDYHVVRHIDDWYALTPGSEKYKPTQATPIPGLTLAGDYTKQKYMATMEGAVLSGQLAAEAVISQQ